MTNSIPYNISVYNFFYHNSNDSMHSYISLRIFTYSNFLPLSYLAYGFYSRLTSHITYTNSFLIITSKKLSAGSVVCRKALGTSNIATSICYFAYITQVFISNSVGNVGEYTLSSGFRYFLCLLPFAQFLPLIFPKQFSLIKFTNSNFSLSYAVSPS